MFPNTIVVFLASCFRIQGVPNISPSGFAVLFVFTVEMMID